MLGIYVLAAMLGGGLLVFSLLSGAHHDVDASGADLHVDVAGADVDFDASGVDVDHDVHVGHDLAAGLLLGFFRPRNLIFSLAAFGLTGTLLTLTGNPEGSTLGLAIGMGAGAWVLTYSVFTWLRRSEALVDVLSDREIEGRTGRAVLPLSPGGPGRVVCVIADQEHYLTARLAADVTEPVEVGAEVVVVRIENGVAEVIPFDALQLPPAEN
jgi:hypothetical protein